MYRYFAEMYNGRLLCTRALVKLWIWRTNRKVIDAEKQTRRDRFCDISGTISRSRFSPNTRISRDEGESLWRAFKDPPGLTLNARSNECIFNIHKLRTFESRLDESNEFMSRNKRARKKGNKNLRKHATAKGKAQSIKYLHTNKISHSTSWKLKKKRKIKQARNVDRLDEGELTLLKITRNFVRAIRTLRPRGVKINTSRARVFHSARLYIIVNLSEFRAICVMRYTLYPILLPCVLYIKRI